MNQPDLADFLGAQLALQRDHMKDGDPRDLFDRDPEVWADFMRWNALALEDELHEAMQEVGWKPWASSRHLNQEAFMKEMVDAWHFFMNLLLAANPGKSVTDIATEFAAKYWEKKNVNAERQRTNYTGLDKCRNCGREFEETQVPYQTRGMRFCNPTCAGENEYER